MINKVLTTVAILLIFPFNVKAQRALEETNKYPLMFIEDFECGEMKLKKSGNPPEVVKMKGARAGKYVMKAQITPDKEISYRTEISLNREDLIFKPGKEYWVGISTMLGDDFNDSVSNKDQGMLFQWHYFDWKYPKKLGLGQPQPLLLRYLGNGQAIIESEVLDMEGKYPGTMVKLSMDTSQWVDWVIHYKLDNEEGFIQVWCNKKLVVDWTGDNHQIEKKEGAYLKFGLYSAQFKNNSWGIDMPANYSRTVYHDEIRIADENGSYQLVAPRNK